jgi:hypothetical protein
MSTDFINNAGNTLRIEIANRPAEASVEKLLWEIEPVIQRQLNFFVLNEKDCRFNFDVRFIDLEDKLDFRTAQVVVEVRLKKATQMGPAPSRWFSFAFVRAGPDGAPHRLFSVVHCDGYGNGVSVREHSPSNLADVDINSECRSSRYIRLVSCALRCLSDWCPADLELSSWRRETRMGSSAHILTLQDDDEAFVVEILRTDAGASRGHLRVVNVDRAAAE